MNEQQKITLTFDAEEFGPIWDRLHQASNAILTAQPHQMTQAAENLASCTWEMREIIFRAMKPKR